MIPRIIYKTQAAPTIEPDYAVDRSPLLPRTAHAPPHGAAREHADRVHRRAEVG